MNTVLKNREVYGSNLWKLWGPEAEDILHYNCKEVITKCLYSLWRATKMIREMGRFRCAGKQGRKIFLHEDSKAQEQVAREFVQPFRTCLDMALGNLLLSDLFWAYGCTSYAWRSVSISMILWSKGQLTVDMTTWENKTKFLNPASRIRNASIFSLLRIAQILFHILIRVCKQPEHIL